MNKPAATSGEVYRSSYAPNQLINGSFIQEDFIHTTHVKKDGFDQSIAPL
ncbi:MAG: hypothetical protein JW973_17135 [Bacteroidales bacterium]|nr:hypothetical protein [Bacteroidales bacterium]